MPKKKITPAGAAKKQWANNPGSRLARRARVTGDGPVEEAWQLSMEPLLPGESRNALARAQQRLRAMLVAHERPEDMLRVMDMVRCQALAGDLTAATLYFDRLLGKSTQPIEVVETPNDLRELSDLDLARAVIDAGMGDQLPEMLRLRVEAHIVAAASGGVRVVASSVKNVQVSSKESPVSSSESAGHAV